MGLFAKKKKTERRKLQLAYSENMPFGYVEAYNALRTNIKFISATNGARVILVTSAVPEESKSNVTVNLATALANSGSAVVVVDCDLRKPTLHRYTQLARVNRGLVDVVAGEDVFNCLYDIKKLKIAALPVGKIPPNPTEIISQPIMREIIADLEEQYDYVLLDAPPVSVVTDAAILSEYTDGAILVIRSDFAPREIIQLAKKRLEDVQCKVLGAVLTRYNAKNKKKSGYSYSYEYDGEKNPQ